jgi:S-adenosylmethionine:tRNA ribosyltransferase-isomerase
MKTSEFSYDLPADLVAQEPAASRDASRLLVYHAASRTLQDAAFGNLPQLVSELRERTGAKRVLFIANDSRVYPARVRVRRASGARGEVFVLRPLGEGPWECLLRPLKKLRIGETLFLDTASLDDSVAVFRVESLCPPRVSVVPSAEGQAQSLSDTLQRFGEMPLPPYIGRDPRKEGQGVHGKLDAVRYQTVYAGTEAGSAAAPTAGLHFTPEIMEACCRAGAQFAYVTLHVGLGTFAPVQTEDVDDHAMHEEWACVPDDVALRLEAERMRRAAGLPPEEITVFVGTTSLRAVESFLRRSDVQPGTWFSTRLFLKPEAAAEQSSAHCPRVLPRAGDALLTNFHQPESTLIMLVAALVGADAWRPLYAHAVNARYRFFSYGDASLLLLSEALGADFTPFEFSGKSAQ